MAEAAHPDANIIFGAMVDEKIQNEVWVTVVATGYGERPVHRARPRADREGIPADREPTVRRTSTARPGALDDLVVPEFLPAQVASPLHEGSGGSRPPADRAGGRGRAARRRQRGRCRDRRHAHVVGGGVAADRARRGRLHARAHVERRDAPARLLRGGARARRGAGRRPSWSRSTSTSPRTRSRCSTSARPRAACTGIRSGSRSARSGSARCRWPTSPRPRRARRATGIEVTPLMRQLFEVLEPILTHTEEARAIYAPEGDAARRRRDDPDAVRRRPDRAPRRRGARVPLRGRRRAGGQRMGVRARRHDHDGGPGELPRGRARARPRASTTDARSSPTRRRRRAGS